jgi:hypothetical protein
MTGKEFYESELVKNLISRVKESDNFSSHYSFLI